MLSDGGCVDEAGPSGVEDVGTAQRDGEDEVEDDRPSVDRQDERDELEVDDEDPREDLTSGQEQLPTSSTGEPRALDR